VSKGVTIKFPGCTADFDLDGTVGPNELGVLLAAMNSRIGDANWNPEADLDHDGKVDTNDRAVFDSQIGPCAPNLVVTVLNNPPATATPGSVVTVSDTVQNQSRIPAGSSRAAWLTPEPEDPSVPQRLLTSAIRIVPRLADALMLSSWWGLRPMTPDQRPVIGRLRDGSMPCDAAWPPERSAVTSPTERGVIGLCTRIRDSAFKRSLVELPVGAEVDVEQPRGKFVLPEDASRPLVFVAGGIGITAFRSMLRYIQDERLPHRVTLIYSNRDRESTAFLDELEQIEQTNPNIRLIVTMTNDGGWPGERRRVDANFFAEYLGENLNDVTYLVAGPPGMAEAATDALKEASVADDLISTDSFSGY